jgi:hypothetical protein
LAAQAAAAAVAPDDTLSACASHVTSMNVWTDRDDYPTDYDIRVHFKLVHPLLQHEDYCITTIICLDELIDEDLPSRFLAGWKSNVYLRYLKIDLQAFFLEHQIDPKFLADVLSCFTHLDDGSRLFTFSSYIPPTHHFATRDLHQGTTRNDPLLTKIRAQAHPDHPHAFVAVGVTDPFTRCLFAALHSKKSIP